MSEKTNYNIETMTGAGKKITLVGREYEVLPIKIEDMKYILMDNVWIKCIRSKSKYIF